MNSRDALGGVIHTYQKYDPQRIPGPRQEPPDLLSGAFDHMLAYGDLRELTDEELARAVKIDPSQIEGLGPSLDMLRAMLEERKRKILSTYETRTVQQDAGQRYRELGERMKPPGPVRGNFEQALKREQLRDLEQVWYRLGDDRSKFARQLVELVSRLADKYQIDEMAGKYTFTGHERLSIPRALEIKEELDTIERLLKQLEEAAKTAQIGVIDLDELSEFADAMDIEKLEMFKKQIEQYLRDVAERQGLTRTSRGYELSPKAYRLFQGRLLEQIFSDLSAARSGRHTGPIVGEGAVEMGLTKPYEFGDSLAQMDIPASFVNALLRQGPGLPVRMKIDDIEVHRTRNTPKCATAVVMDMSGSMRYGGQYIHVKRMALALEGLIRREYPGDYLHFVEMYTFAKPRLPSEIVSLMPKPVSMSNPVIRLKADMSDDSLSVYQIPAHFTNIQHGLQTARRLLATADTPNRQIILITDGLPTAHFEQEWLYMLYPPDPRTEHATLREGKMCERDQITINIFLLPSWSQSREDVQFAYQLAQSTKGRVFFTGGSDLDRYVVWDYVSRRRQIIA